MSLLFVFDVESIGLHGEGYAVGGGLFNQKGECLWDFLFAAPQSRAIGNHEDRAWVEANCPLIRTTHEECCQVRDAFWAKWLEAKSQGAVMAADCGWPVEARFLIECVNQDPINRNWEGPYPMLEISTLMLAAGKDPLGVFERTEEELPKHNPLADAKQSARLLHECLAHISKEVTR